MTYLSSSPYQRVPSTPQVSTRTNLFSSPSFRVPQIQNLYSSPVPDRTVVVDVRDGLQSSPINPFQFLSQDDSGLISEGAAVGDGVEQIVPATPNRTTDYASGSQIQVPFTIDPWTSETPQMYPFRFQSQMFSQTSVDLSQDEISIENSRVTETTTDSRLIIRRTPSSQRRISNASRVSSPRSGPRTRTFSRPILPNMHRTPQHVEDPQPNDSLRAPEVFSDVLHTPIRPSGSILRTNLRRTPRRLSNDPVIHPDSRIEPPEQAREQVSLESPKRLNVQLQRHAKPLLDRVSRSSSSRNSSVGSELDIFCTDNIFG
ncbi:hypothetical protein LOTGIDRAFT_172179 [Lottia gigantea]|uniref:Uncharacterized protein n=1 Tax=Lottia gigantea TaxID=225164 RepID=V4CJC9_LOTGI|nr:hypothetical protein LOTGIDRAFT_172179 [Lottia gigantea]ESP02300.1 hypothetical protein LOTGIDRAFT_172179 [Lottia gigantea]